jgi:hypothetical protein
MVWNVSFRNTEIVHDTTYYDFLFQYYDKPLSIYKVRVLCLSASLLSCEYEVY